MQQLRQESQVQLESLREELRGQAEQLRLVRSLLGQPQGFIKGEAVSNALLRRQMLSEFLTKKG